MAKRVTDNDIYNINKIYALCGNISKTAESTGWSTSTVRKYIDKNFKLEVSISDFLIDFPPIEDTIQNLQNGINILSLTKEEISDLSNIRKRVII